MPLPKCVKTLELSPALEGEGWRHVGTLLIFRGWLARQFCNAVRILDPHQVLGLAEQIEWSGRLWRDPEITKNEAFRETIRHIKESDCTIYAVGRYPAAFGMFSGSRVVLIGTHPAAQGLGLASKLIRHAILGDIVAGTYSDNDAAIALYKGLGMEISHKEEVYHK